MNDCRAVQVEETIKQCLQGRKFRAKDTMMSPRGSWPESTSIFGNWQVETVEGPAATQSGHTGAWSLTLTCGRNAMPHWRPFSPPPTWIRPRISSLTKASRTFESCAAAPRTLTPHQSPECGGDNSKRKRTQSPPTTWPNHSTEAYHNYALRSL